MKNRIRLYGIIAAAALIGLGVAGCDNPTQSGTVQGGGSDITEATAFDWTGISAGAGSSPFNDDVIIGEVAYGNGMWIALGGSIGGSGTAGRTWIAYSQNGTDWIEGVEFPFPEGVVGVRSVTFGGGRWVAVGGVPYRVEQWNVILHSADGKTWETGHTFEINNRISAIAYGSGRWVGSGRRPNGTGLMVTSVNGIDWEIIDNDILELGHIAFGGGRWIGVQMGGRTDWFHSTNGTDWELIPSWNLGVNAIAYGGGRWAAISTSGFWITTMRSTDGISWSSENIQSSLRLHSMAWGNGRWFAVGGGETGNNMAYSEDGINWTFGAPFADGSEFRTPYNAVAHGGGRWVAVGWDGIMAWRND